MPRELTGTIWVSDMSGFTVMTHLLGSDTVMARVFAMREVLSETIRGRRGHIFKCVADNVLAVFDSPLDAIHAAEEAHALLDADARVCVGIGHGRMMLFPGEEDYFGMEVNLASKLGEDIAEPGDVLLTEGAFRALPAPFQHAFDGPHILPVKQFQFHYYRLAGPVAEGRPTEIIPPIASSKP